MEARSCEISVPGEAVDISWAHRPKSEADDNSFLSCRFDRRRFLELQSGFKVREVDTIRGIKRAS